MILERTLATLKHRGLRLDTVYDIGACVGLWTRHIRSILPAAKFVLFEANPAYRDTLTQSGLGRVCMGVLSNPGRTFVEFFNGTNTGDSYYRENTSVYEGQESVRLSCITLDEFGVIADLPPPDFIKIDTQGSELDILSGGLKALEHAVLVQIEVPFVAYNRGAPAVGDYLDCMKTSDFLPIAFLDAHYIDGVMIQGDLLFMKRDPKEEYLQPTKILRLS